VTQAGAWFGNDDSGKLILGGGATAGLAGGETTFAGPTKTFMSQSFSASNFVTKLPAEAQLAYLLFIYSGAASTPPLSSQQAKSQGDGQNSNGEQGSTSECICHKEINDDDGVNHNQRSVDWPGNRDFSY
jgi:hypothetical protein